MDLNQLLVFAKVAENQSFTKAAKELGMEKSTVSSKVSQLEKRLGLRLLNRTTRLVTLTEEGEGYYQYCHQIVNTAREADHYADTLTNEPQGVLRISVPLDFGLLLVHQLVKPFMREYPNLKIDLFVIDREVDLIAERYDIALRIGPGLLKDSSLIGKKLFNVKMGLFASPQFLSEYGEPKTPDDLQNTPFVIFTKQQEPVFEFSSGFMPEDFKVSGNLKINDILISKEAALSGLGIAIMPVAIAQAEIKLQKLKPILPEYDLPPMALFAVYPSRQWMPSKLKVFLKYLENWKG
ncbi:MAG: LysR family transcriptional regulator [Thiohalomonadales bacterium]